MSAASIGPFDLQEKLGTGGMGVVYRAAYRKNGRIVALKVLTPDLSSNPKLVARFEREMAILEKLDHPNITRYYGGGKSRGQHFYAMRLMGGGTLAELLKRRHSLPWEQVVEYGLQICDALDHAHEHGVIHRDLKPANLFLRQDRKTGQERIVLGDFGIARDMEASGLTATGMTVGTYAYMAPEQIDGKHPITGRTDLYALGCVLFEMLTGQTPFQGGTAGELMVKHLQEEPQLVRHLAVECPLWLENVVSQLLSKQPADRPHDAACVALALEEVRSRVAEQASVSTQITSGGPGTRSMAEVHPELKKLLAGSGRKKKRKRKRGPFWESAWFLLCCLASLIGAVTWAVWPASEAELFAQAQPLMESEDTVHWRDAVKLYLEPMLERFPNGEHAGQARDFINRFEVGRLKRRLINSARLNLDPESEPERLFMEAWRYEQFGDRITALAHYRSMIVLLKAKEETLNATDDRYFIPLAQSQIADIEATVDTSADRITFVNSSLLKADELLTSGRLVEAQKMWNSIVSLYSTNQEFAPQVEYARARLRGDTPPDLTLTPADSSDPSATHQPSDTAPSDPLN
ncbi:MAG: protein kinase [Rhodopirellula sp.]|nr:protein kinase [Rhodopirellula sp.]